MKVILADCDRFGQMTLVPIRPVYTRGFLDTPWSGKLRALRAKTVCVNARPVEQSHVWIAGPGLLKALSNLSKYCLTCSFLSIFF